MKAEKLVIDAARAQTALKSIRDQIKHLKDYIFIAKPRRNVPEAEKPTIVQRRAYRANIKSSAARAMASKRFLPAPPQIV